MGNKRLFDWGISWNDANKIVSAVIFVQQYWWEGKHKETEKEKEKSGE